MSSVLACWVCEQELSGNALRCSRCKTAYYCSAEHQKQDWKKHKKLCKKGGPSPSQAQVTPAAKVEPTPVETTEKQEPAVKEEKEIVTINLAVDNGSLPPALNLDINGVPYQHPRNNISLLGLDPQSKLVFTRRCCHKCGVTNIMDFAPVLDSPPPEDIRFSECSRCRHVAYCSVACQKADNREHKELCIALAATRDELLDSTPQEGGYGGFLGGTQEDWVTFVTKQREVLGEHLTRPAGLYEGNYLYYARKCFTCFKIYEFGDAKARKQMAALECQDCYLCWYCSDECKEAGSAMHSKACETGKMAVLQDALYCNLQRTQAEHKTIVGAIWVPDTVNEVYSPLPKPYHWGSYFQERKAPRLPGSYFALSTHSLSMVVTLAAALELSYPPSSLTASSGILSSLSTIGGGINTKSTLTIHMLGANMGHEMVCSPAFEEIFHLLPNLNKLEIVMICPEFDDTAPKRLPLCPTCTSDGRVFTIATSHHIYHDYVAAECTDPKDHPDLVIAYNAGMYQTPQSWTPTVRWLLSKGIPSFFTCFNVEEFNADSNLLQLLDAQMLVAGQNPWMALRPFVEPLRPNKFFYCNRYWLGFRSTVGATELLLS